jgi:hypothetical protein
LRALGTFLAVLAALIWSAVVWGGYGLLLFSSSLLASPTGGAWLPPEMVGWAALLDGLLRDYGTGITAAVWAIGLLGIVALRALYNWLLGMAASGPTQVPASPPAGNDDLPPSLPPVPTPAPADPARWGRNARQI